MKYEHQNIFFISDLHLSHKNVLKFDDRPFKDVNEMHAEFIKRWNSVVNDEDIVYYLGDLSFGNDTTTKWFLSSIKGKIYFIMGNHDRIHDIAKFGRFEKIHEYGTEIYVKDEDFKSARGSGGYQQIVLNHYPILSWNRAHYGSIHLHGHCHQGLTKDPNFDWFYKKKVMDVGCNGINYTPISYQGIKEIMIEKEISAHH